MNNSAGKKTLKENLFNRQYSVALINLILAIFIITMKNLETETKKLRNSEMKLKKKKTRCNTCHIYHINAWNRAYLILYHHTKHISF